LKISTQANARLAMSLPQRLGQARYTQNEGLSQIVFTKTRPSVDAQSLSFLLILQSQRHSCESRSFLAVLPCLYTLDCAPVEERVVPGQQLKRLNGSPGVASYVSGACFVGNTRSRSHSFTEDGQLCLGFEADVRDFVGQL